MSRAHLLTPSELSALRDLELLARSTVDGLRHGLHRSPFHGYSAEFSQYRHYRPGDDLKYVDWKAFARTDRLYSRQFRDTTNLATLFAVDVSRSMAFPPEETRGTRGRGPSGRPAAGGVAATKFALARAVAAALGTLVIDQGDAAALLAVGDADAAASFLPPRSGRHHLRALLAELARLTPTGRASVATGLARAARLLRRRGLIVVLSDLYDEDAALSELRRLARMQHDVVVIHTLAREELALPERVSAEFEDLETGRTMVADTAAIGARYARAVAQFVDRVQRAVERDGLDYLRLVTGEPLEPALRRFLVARRGGG